MQHESLYCIGIAEGSNIEIVLIPSNFFHLSSLHAARLWSLLSMWLGHSKVILDGALDLEVPLLPTYVTSIKVVLCSECIFWLVLARYTSFWVRSTSTTTSIASVASSVTSQ